MFRPRIALALVLAALLAGPVTSALAASARGPREVVAETVDDVLAILRDSSLSTEVRRDRLVEIARERFDYPTMSKLVLAKYWRRFDAGQRKAFMAEFEGFLARRYGDRIDRYPQESVEITGERSTKLGDVIVATRIHRPGGAEPVLVDYRMRQANGAWRVIDVKIEGISLVSNYRDQFHTVLSRGSPDKLIAQLRERNASQTIEDPVD